MENSINQNSELQGKAENSEKSVVLDSAKVGKKNKAQRKALKKSTEINLNSVKINLSKMDKSLLTKTSVSSKREIYKGTDGMNSDEKKTHRNKLRRELKRFVNSILGKDRSEKERTESVKNFISFYKANWKIQDFKIENFSQKKNEADLKDYINLLKFVSSVLG